VVLINICELTHALVKLVDVTAMREISAVNCFEVIDILLIV